LTGYRILRPFGIALPELEVKELEDLGEVDKKEKL